MTASELFRAGKLQEAIEAQLKEVKANPADHGRRLFLFELCCFAGDLDRARRQVESVRYDEPGRDAAVLGYRKALDAEEHRRRVFAEGVAPEFLGDPPAHLKLRLEAAGLLRLGRPAEAAALLERANAETPAATGKLNGKPFMTLRDGDDLFAGVLEVMAQGRYFWVPLEQVVGLAMNPPKYPRDLVYRPARLDTEAETGEVFLPVLYPNTHLHPDDQVRLGRATEWKAEGGGPVLGAGAHDFLVDDEPVGLLEWTALVRDADLADAVPAPEEEPGAAPEGGGEVEGESGGA
jgi:type VI secretion system protein ImpE